MGRTVMVYKWWTPRHWIDFRRVWHGQSTCVCMQYEYPASNITLWK